MDCKMQRRKPNQLVLLFCQLPTQHKQYIVKAVLEYPVKWKPLLIDITILSGHSEN